MQPHAVARRSFLKYSAATAAATVALPWARAQTTLAVRMEWQQFKTTVWYTPFIAAIGTMKANTNALDRNSWQYWINVHRNFCPHNASYFLGWHRGYLASLERQMRIVSGMADMPMPYWNYYQYAQMPAEFLDASTGNPLYVPNRRGSNVFDALSLAPFDSSVTNFRRGLSNAFEPTIESRPHGPVHNLIGGVMATMRSPTDPIFFMHHGNIDRLWLAWVRAGAGRVMPPRTHSYWRGSFTYATDLTLPRVHAWDTHTDLGYDYDDTAMPTSIPLAQKASSGVVQVQAKRTAPALPPAANAARTPAGSTGATTHSLGGVKDFGLDERSVTVQLPVAAPHAAALQGVARNGAATIPSSALSFRSAHLVLDGLRVTPRGAEGGYFYEVYLNLPASGDYVSSKEQYLIGTLGPFEVEAGQHHGIHSTLTYPLGDQIAGMSTEQLSQLTVSFVRVDGLRPPPGRVIDVQEVRIELSTDAER
jgi:tyrosinase